METYTITLRGIFVNTVSLSFLCLSIAACFQLPSSCKKEDLERYETRGTPAHKVQLTQKGYIQFLRWELPVPEITQFTFCLWMESNDLTHPHSIFSYSKHERDRLVRAWISPHGRSVHLEIGGTEVFAASTDIHENRWYHLCQSWENEYGRYALWINGQLWVQGQSEETTGYVVPSGGDIVLGQEYTDFDKGLEDGIEGSVLDFNLLLSSAFEPPRLASAGFDRRRDDYDRERTRITFPSSRATRAKVKGRDTYSERTIGPWLRRIEKLQMQNDPLGLQLVKLSYARCDIGKGSPFIVRSPLMLISWSRTPVRIFGGATVKNVNNCLCYA